EHGSVRFRNSATGEVVHTLRLRKNDREPETEGALTPDGRFLAVRDTAQDIISLWDLTTRKEVRRFPVHKDDYGPVAISPDGATVAAGGQGKTEHAIRLWDAASGKPRATIEFNPSSLDSLDFSPDGKTLVSGGRAPLYVRSWDVATGKEKHNFGPAPCENS